MREMNAALLPVPLYICPLCIDQFFVATFSGIMATTEFSHDHLPPKSVGGRFKVLTCKKCNNDSGQNEATLQETLNLGSVPDKRTKSIFPNLRVGNKETNEFFKAKAYSENGAINIKFNEAATKHNSDLRSFSERIKANEFSSLTLFLEMPDQNKIALALLKSAYLLSFAYWGYSFVYSMQGQYIREVLQGTRKYPVRTPAFFKNPETDPMQKGINIFRLHGNKEAFLNVLELKTSHEHVVAGILIPNPTATGWEQLAALNEVVEGKTPTLVEATTIPVNLVPDGYSSAWNLIP